MKWSELRKLAIRYGWTLKRHGSRHDIYAHPNQNYFIELGRHDSEEVKNGTCAKIKKQIGVQE